MLGSDLGTVTTMCQLFIESGFLTSFRVGEKYLEWVDHNEPLSLDTILSMVSFYWFTETLPRSIYPYRSLISALANSNFQPQAGKTDGEGAHAPPIGSRDKPLGISAFPAELVMIPKAWAEKVYPNLVIYKRHPVVSCV